MKKRFLTICMISVLAAALALTGCGASAGANQGLNQESIANSADATQNVLTIGVATDDSAPSVVTNDTGQSISGISVKADDAKTFGASLLPGGVTWANATIANIYLPVNASEKTQSFDIRLTLDNKKKITLHAVKLNGLKDISLRIDEKTGLGYLEYKTALEQDESTLAAEKKVVAKAEAAAKKKAAEKAAAAAAKKKAANAASGSTNKKQSADNCLDDPILR